MNADCGRAQEAIEALFLGELKGADFDRLRAHVKTCDDCREQYERVARVDAALEKGGLSEARLSAMEDQLFARLAPAKPAFAPRWQQWLVPLFGALAVLIIALPLSRMATGRADEFQARGGASSAFGVRAFCVQDAHVIAQARSGGALRCPVGAVVQFTYTAPKDSALDIAIAGTSDVFFQASHVEAGTDVVLPQSTPVTAQWLHAPVKVVATFRQPGGSSASSEITLSP